MVGIHPFRRNSHVWKNRIPLIGWNHSLPSFCDTIDEINGIQIPEHTPSWTSTRCCNGAFVSRNRHHHVAEIPACKHFLGISQRQLRSPIFFRAQRLRDLAGAPERYWPRCSAQGISLETISAPLPTIVGGFDCLH